MSENNTDFWNKIPLSGKPVVFYNIIVPHNMYDVDNENCINTLLMLQIDFSVAYFKKMLKSINFPTPLRKQNYPDGASNQQV